MMQVHPSGTRIANRYEVVQPPDPERHFLAGGMGLVYLCVDRQQDLPVALKTFKPEYLPDRPARERFLQEGNTWVRLGKHAHIVRCYGVERIGDGREVYLVLELVAKQEGRRNASLRAWLTPGQALPADQALLIALQIARGMAHATRIIPGFVHRDLKPENVLVGADRLTSAAGQRVRVTDFGLATVAEQAAAALSELSGTGAPAGLARTRVIHGVAGTPLYMAPEQWRRQPLDLRTDVYALGCILQEMVTGHPAAAGDSITDLERAHCTGRLRPIPDTLPVSAKRLVARCLALEQAGRFESWQAVEDALTAAHVEITSQAVPEPQPAQELDRAEHIALGWSHNAIGLSYRDIGNARVAVSHFERALAVGRAEGERRLQAAGLGNLGMAHADLAESRRAIEYLEQAVAIDWEIGSRRGAGRSLGSLGVTYRNLGEPRRAIECHEQALLISREIGDRHQESAALGNLGIAYSDLGEPRRAIKYHEERLVVAREIGDRHLEGNALGDLGNAYNDLGELRRASEYFEEHLAIARAMGDRRGEGSALGNLGNVYYRLNEPRRAIAYFQQCLAVAREIGDRHYEGNCLGNLGSAHAALGESRRAIEHFEQHLEIARAIGDRRSEAITSWNLGRSLEKEGDLKAAAAAMQVLVDYERRMGHPAAEEHAATVAALRARVRG